MSLKPTHPLKSKNQKSTKKIKVKYGRSELELRSGINPDGVKCWYWKRKMRDGSIWESQWFESVSDAIESASDVRSRGYKTSLVFTKENEEIGGLL